MSERDSFLKAIAANPAEDTPRLAFADWLDEHGEADLAEFIRLQIKREQPGENPDGFRLLPREQELLDANKEQWLGPLGGLDQYDGFDAMFRRGFVESAMIFGRIVGEHAEAIRAYCPCLTTVEVVGVRGHGLALAGAPFLKSVRALHLEDWPYPADAEALAASPHLARVESLSVWLGSRNDEAVCRAIGSAKSLPALRNVNLIQLRGGMTARADASELNANADRLAAIINGLRAAPAATVERPFDALFPLAEYVGRDMYGGTLSDGRRVLAVGGRECDLLYFDDEGYLMEGERLDLSAELTRRPRYSYEVYNDEELFERLASRIGFTRGMIWVREFDASTVIPNHCVSVYKFGGTATEVFENPDSPDQYFTDDWEGALDNVRYWLHSDNFCITAADECWADGRGAIHTT